MPRLLRPVALAATLAALLAGDLLPAAGQSSMFGVRGLGLPGRPLTPRTRATAGSFGLFDGESDVNPAALPNLRAVAAGFVMAPNWRSWQSPAGDASLRETRFPLVYVGGPVPRTRLGLGISIGSYADRDFRLATTDTVVLRGAPVAVFDTLKSLGGLNEVRFAAGLQLGGRTSVGLGVHWITGSNRLESRRAFEDTTFISFRQTAELSYQGVGFSAGLTHQLSSRVQLALMLRSDGKATVDLDSARAYSIDLPVTVSAGALLRASPRLTLATSGQYRTWSAANSDLQARGGVGAENTLELSLGGELIRNPRRPSTLPFRAGVRYAQLPFPVQAGHHPREWSVSAGTGTRFAQDRAGVDLALEHAWRSEGGAYKERAFGLILGLSIRPYGGGGR